jgi:hypothetical protein
MVVEAVLWLVQPGDRKTEVERKLGRKAGLDWNGMRLPRTVNWSIP